MQKIITFLKYLAGIPLNAGLSYVLLFIRTDICATHSKYQSFCLLEILSLFVSVSYILVYDKWIKKDVFGIEGFKAIGETDKQSLLIKLIVWLKKKGKYPLLTVIAFEPVATNLLFRKGHHEYDGRFADKRAFVLMLVSITITSLYWTGFLKLVISWIR